MKMRAAVLEAVRSPLVTREVTLAPLKHNDVLVRMGASGFCHTDYEVIEGTLKRPFPIILGHEGAGVVQAVGGGVTKVRPGDHVVCSWNPACGHCFYCDRGLKILCEPVAKWHVRGALTDGESRLQLQNAPLNHFSMISSHAEFSIVPEAGAIRITKELPFDRACLIGCSVMTGYGAATRLAPISAGSSVLVVGCGAVGLNVIQGAVKQEAEKIIAVDTDLRHLALAREFGATLAIDATTSEAAERIREHTAGRGADYAFEAAGKAAAMRLAIEASRPGAHIVILGKIPVDELISLKFGSLMGEKRIIRSSYGGADPEFDFPVIAEEYLRGRIKLDELVGRRLALDDINDAVQAVRANEPGRSVIIFD